MAANASSTFNVSLPYIKVLTKCSYCCGNHPSSMIAWSSSSKDTSIFSRFKINLLNSSNKGASVFLLELIGRCIISSWDIAYFLETQSCRDISLVHKPTTVVSFDTFRNTRSPKLWMIALGLNFDSFLWSCICRCLSISTFQSIHKCLYKSEELASSYVITRNHFCHWTSQFQT